MSTSLTSSASAPAVARTPHPAAVAGLALAPLALLAGVLLLIANVGLPALAGLPVETLAVERVTLEEGVIHVTVRNFGPEAVTIAHVTVDENLASFTQNPPGEIARLTKATVTIPWHWIEAEPVGVTLLTANAFKFEAEVEAAVLTPTPDASTLGLLALIGLYVGAVPVLLGLLWRPLIARVSPKALTVFLGVTVGLLLFLAADSVLDGFEVSEALPEAAGAPFLLIGGAILAFLVLEQVSSRSDVVHRPMVIALMLAIGIGLHNLAEGLAIGGAFALGEVALGAFLIIGFALHNTTEGLAIVAAAAKQRVTIAALVGLGLIAGLPVVPGAWLGTFAPNPYLGIVFLGIGAGAIAQVALTVHRSTGRALTRGPGLTGVLAGVAIMFVTSFLVVI